MGSERDEIWRVLNLGESCGIDVFSSAHTTNGSMNASESVTGMVWKPLGIVELVSIDIDEL
jgi:hypothetical protein